MCIKIPTVKMKYLKNPVRKNVNFQENNLSSILVFNKNLISQEKDQKAYLKILRP